MTEGYDAKVDPHYAGDLHVMLRFTPMHTQNQTYAVKESDIRAWVMFGVIEEDAYVQKFVAKAAKLEKAVKAFEKKMVDTANAPIFDARGREQHGDIVDVQRTKQYQEIAAEKEELATELAKAKKDLRSAMETRVNSKLHVRQGKVDVQSDRCTWIIEFDGVDKDHYEDLVCKKLDWNGIRLAVGEEDELRPREPYTGRGAVPDGSKPFIPDLRDYIVNMYGVRVTRFEDGFGTYRELDKRSSSYSGKQFQFYYGTFSEGKKEGHCLWYNDEGIYSGQVKDDQPQGKGRMDYANGDSITGEFKVRAGHKNSLLGTNPYSRGEPNGYCKRTFADGSFYEGEFLDGKINGHGSYINAMGEQFEGDFKHGYFHGKGTFLSAVDEVYEGTWFEGLLHGEGSYVNSNDDKYVGGFDRGEKHGKGAETFSSNNRFVGFYQDGMRILHGETWYGNVTEEVGSKGETKLLYDCKHEGPWRAGMMRSGGLVTFTSTRNCWPSMHKVHYKYPFLSKLRGSEDAATKRQNFNRQKKYDIDRMLRAEIEKKKLIVFQNQRHHAKREMVFDESNPLDMTEDLIEGSLNIRRDRIAQAANKNRQIIMSPRTIDEAESNPGFTLGNPNLLHGKRIPRLRIAALELDDKLRGEGVVPRKTILSKLLQSDFEEMEEKRRLINAGNIKKKITAKVDALHLQMIEESKD